MVGPAYVYFIFSFPFIAHYWKSPFCLFYSWKDGYLKNQCQKSYNSLIKTAILDDLF